MSASSSKSGGDEHYLNKNWFCTSSAYELQEVKQSEKSTTSPSGEDYPRLIDTIGLMYWWSESLQNPNQKCSSTSFSSYRCYCVCCFFAQSL
ncbi:Bgt-20543 [Blumeria graminis f. sp. tritici]|nr:Bgt-20543 [Blumeria graminis f. sp. tritici]